VFVENNNRRLDKKVPLKVRCWWLAERVKEEVLSGLYQSAALKKTWVIQT